jgi:hypothetical protein
MMLTNSRRDWTIAVAGIILAAVVWISRGRAAREGAIETFVITVVPVDRAELACDARHPIGSLQCQYDGRGHLVGEATPTTNDRWLHPYVTTGGALLLLSGVFTETHVADWIAGAMAAGSSERVTLTCRARIAGTSGPVRVRWNDQGPWEDKDGLVAAAVDGCLVSR